MRKREKRLARIKEIDTMYDLYLQDFSNAKGEVAVLERSLRNAEEFAKTLEINMDEIDAELERLVSHFTVEEVEALYD